MRPLCVLAIFQAGFVCGAEGERSGLPRKGTDAQRPRVNGLGGDMCGWDVSQRGSTASAVNVQQKRGVETDREGKIGDRREDRIRAS